MSIVGKLEFMNLTNSTLRASSRFLVEVINRKNVNNHVWVETDRLRRVLREVAENQKRNLERNTLIANIISTDASEMGYRLHHFQVQPGNITKPTHREIYTKNRPQF
uniref:Uncharacterized protein n=1 Tax=Strongyloides venezuelensis TaxID=75913 RepID=A0A0K0FHE1_STRVS